MADQESYSSGGCGCCGELEPLEKALKTCLGIINDYFGLTDAELKVAVEEAKRKGGDWSPYDDGRWGKIAYPPAPVDRNASNRVDLS